MALGIIEPRDGNHIPGTVFVYKQQQSDAEQLCRGTHLKRDKTGKIILVPQPSDDPNDPLNWPLWKRDLVMFILSLVAVIATTSAPLLAADSIQLALVFNVTFQKAANLTAYLLAGCAVGAVICVPSARVWGKRHVFLLGALLMCGASAWGGATHINNETITQKHRNYNSIVWARVFQGVALAPFESLTNAVVGDLYHVHERGPRMAFVNTAIFGGAFLTPVFVGMIAKNIGWQWSFYLLAIFMGVGFLALFFFVPETAFRRDRDLNTDITAHQHLNSQENASDIPLGPTAQSDGSTNSSTSSPPKTPNQHTSTSKTSTTPPPRASYTTQLLPLRPGTRYTSDSFFKLLLRPFPLYLHPAVFWGCLMQGVIIGWTVMVGVILSLVFYQPPLFFTEEKAGKMYTSAFIGSIVGLLLSGLFTEFTTRWLIAKNNGKYEPEFRLLLALPTLVFCSVGLYGFGITADNTYKYGWLIPDVFIGFVIAGMVMGAIASAQYLLDAYREIDIEIFTNLIIFKNVFSFVLAYKAYDWVFQSGIKEMFVVFGSIEVAICVLSAVVYVGGKWARGVFGVGRKLDLIRLCRLW